MSGPAASKALLYVVNRVSSDDTQHFVHIPNLLRKLSGHGWSVQLISERGGTGCTEIEGVSVSYLSNEGRWSRLPKLIRRLLAAYRQGNRLVFIRISKSSALISAILGRLVGWKTLFWVSGAIQDFNIRERGWRGRLENASLGLVLHLVDVLVTGPEEMKEYYSEYFHLSKKKIIVLYNDIETSNVASSKAAELPGSVEERVLMVHRLSPVRDTMNWFPHIIEALAARRAAGHGTRLDVVGTGPELFDLQRAAVGHDGLVQFFGEVPNRELGDFYARADLFLMPSAREGFPRVCLEAMARGLPIVATDAGGTRDIFGPHQQDFVVSRADPIRFVRRMLDLLDSPGTRNILAAENLKHVERFSTDAVAAMYDRRLSELLTR